MITWNNEALKMLITISSILMFSACSGGGGGGSSPNSPSPVVSFSGASSPGSNTVYMAKNSSLSSGDTLAIDVKANSISGSAKGAAFDVDFDSAKLTYLDKAAGDFFGAGSTTDVALQSGSTNKVIVGATTSSGTVTGSGTIVTLKFKATGNSAVGFSNNELRDSGNLAISGVTWSGGNVTVQ